jgi:membrane protease YdiL (CAAX protease family)
MSASRSGTATLPPSPPANASPTGGSDPGQGLLPWIAVGTGLIVLVGRQMVRMPGWAGVAALVAIYASLAVLSLVPPGLVVTPARTEPSGAASGASPLHPLAALIIGLAAFRLSEAAVGPAVPVAGGLTVVALNSVAAVAEEAFFRRFLFDRLLRFGPAAAVAVSAVAFALVHVPAYGLTAFWVDLGAGLLLSWQRWASGTWTIPAATHVAANLMVVIG